MALGRLAGPKVQIPALSTFNSLGLDEASLQGVVRIGWVLSAAGDMPQQNESV
jgi:hypothetical protein